jgi:hypothetical protein
VVTVMNMNVYKTQSSSVDSHPYKQLSGIRSIQMKVTENHVVVLVLGALMPAVFIWHLLRIYEI